MSNEKFTQGEWNIADCRETPYAGYDYLIVDADRLAIAYIENCSQEEQEANANLIAAAPEMYRVLDKCQSCIQHFLDGRWDDAVAGETGNLLIEIEAVLKKARGEE